MEIRYLTLKFLSLNNKYYWNAKEYNNQLVIGRNPVLELLKSERQIEKIYIQQGMKGEFEIELRNLLKGKNIPVSHVHPAKLNGITSQNHQESSL